MLGAGPFQVLLVYVRLWSATLDVPTNAKQRPAPLLAASSAPATTGNGNRTPVGTHAHASSLARMYSHNKRYNTVTNHQRNPRPSAHLERHRDALVLPQAQLLEAHQAVRVREPPPRGVPPQRRNQLREPLRFQAPLEEEESAVAGGRSEGGLLVCLHRYNSRSVPLETRFTAAVLVD